MNPNPQPAGEREPQRNPDAPDREDEREAPRPAEILPAARALAAVATALAHQTGLRGTRAADVIASATAAVDAVLTEQVAAVQHSAPFQTLESAWLGLRRLVDKTQLGPLLKIQVLPVTAEELRSDFDENPRLEDTALYQKVYAEALGMPELDPIGMLVGDFAFDASASSVGLLRKIAEVSERALCPFIAAAAPKLFGYESWEGLDKVGGLDPLARVRAQKGQRVDEYAEWHNFEDSELARYIVLTLPRVLARVPHGTVPFGADGATVKTFDYREAMRDASENLRAMPNQSLCWMSAAWVLAERITASYAKSRMGTSIVGPLGGGLVEDLPLYRYLGPDGALAVQSPTEVTAPFVVEKAFSDAGTAYLLHNSGTPTGVFLGVQNAKQPKTIRGDEKYNSDQRIQSGVAYNLSFFRVLHLLKMYGRRMLGLSMTREEIERNLHDWVRAFVLVGGGTEAQKAEHPFADAKVEVFDVPGQPGVYDIKLWLKPWLKISALLIAGYLTSDIPTVK